MIGKLLFLCPMLLFAGIVDGISGGGGLIALPSYLMAGLPITTAYGCNKLQSFLGTSASFAKYAGSGLFDLRSAAPAAITAVAGSWCATQIMLSLSDGVKSVIIAIAMVFVMVLTVFSGRVSVEKFTATKVTSSWKNVLICLSLGFLLGLYDGFFGPGGGTVAALLFAVILKLDLRVGCGNGKAIVLVSNFASMITYMLRGEVLYQIALPCAAANIIGSYIGASLATKKGAKFVKYVSYAVVAMLLVQAVTTVLQK